MRTHTHFIERPELLNLISEVLKNLQSKYDKLAESYLDGNDSASFSGKGIFSLAATLVSKPTNVRMTNYDLVEAVVVSQLLEIVDKAEKLSEGGGSVAFETCVAVFQEELPKYLEAGNRNYAAAQKLVKHNLDVLAAAMAANAEPYPKEEIYELISKTLDGPNLSAAVLQALELAGIQGNIVVEASLLTETLQVEKKTGYHFQGVTIPAAFLKNVTREWRRQNVKVLCVDGIIEKVSELDKILSEANKTKQSLVLVAQGFSEEVLGTLQVNFSRKLLDVVPVLLEPSLETLNVVNDISVVCGNSSLVSTLQGEMLLYKTMESLPTVEKIVLTGTSMIIEHTSTRPAVLSHVKELLNKRTQKLSEGFQLTDLSLLYEKRIHSLMANTICLTLPSSTNGVATSKREKIDRVLRSIKTKLAYGKVNLKNLSTLEQLQYIKTPKVTDDLYFVDHLATFVGLWFGCQKAVELLFTAGTVVAEP